MDNNNDEKKCKNCMHFFDCFNYSNTLLGIDDNDITPKMIKDAEEIPACEKYVCIK